MFVSFVEAQERDWLFEQWGRLIFFLVSLGSQEWFYVGQHFEDHFFSLSLGKERCV